MLVNHVKNLVEYFGTRCYCWDVVNEALSDSGTGNLADNATWRSDLWYNTIGPQYINIAFETAAKYAPPSVKLYYNGKFSYLRDLGEGTPWLRTTADYNIESPGNKTTAAYQLVQYIKDAGLRIDGVGMQSHFIVGETPSTGAQMSVMANFTSLGVEVAQTELDIRAFAPDNAGKPDTAGRRLLQFRRCMRKDAEVCWNYSMGLRRYLFVGTFDVPGTGLCGLV